MISALDLLKCRDRPSSVFQVVLSSCSMIRLPYACESWERPPGLLRLGASPVRQLPEKSTEVISSSMWRNRGAVYPYFALCLKSIVVPSFPEAAFGPLLVCTSQILPTFSGLRHGCSAIRPRFFRQMALSVGREWPCSSYPVVTST